MTLYTIDVTDETLLTGDRVQVEAPDEATAIERALAMTLPNLTVATIVP